MGTDPIGRSGRRLKPQPADLRQDKKPDPPVPPTGRAVRVLRHQHDPPTARVLGRQLRLALPSELPGSLQQVLQDGRTQRHVRGDGDHADRLLTGEKERQVVHDRQPQQRNQEHPGIKTRGRSVGTVIAYFYWVH